MKKRFRNAGSFGERFGGSWLMVVVLTNLLMLSLFGAAASLALKFTGDGHGKRYEELMPAIKLEYPADNGKGSATTFPLFSFLVS